MEPLCEFCGVVRAVVYCRSDSARLCLNCDFCVHSANSLSSRHDRSLICDKCNSQPATVRCIEDKISLCQGCNWNGNGCSGPGHHRQRLTFYSGCPSLSELSRIWSSVLDNSNNNNNFNKLSINENSIDSTTSSDQPSINTEGGGMVANRLNELASWVKFESWITNPPVNVVPLIPPMPMPLPMSMPINNIVTVDEDSSGLPKLHGITTTQTLNAKDLDHQEEDAGGVDVDDDDDDDDYNGVDLDDVALMFDENTTTTTTGYHVHDMLGGININSQEVNSRYCKEDLFMDNKNLSFTESNSLIDTNNNNALEASSCGQQDCMGFQSTRICSPVNLMQNLSGSPNSLLMNAACNRNIGLGFPPGQVHPSMSLSLSNITGESSATDYQDCGLSPVFLSGESPWESNLEPTHPHSRDKAKMRYHEKKKTRMFGKQIRYASRKARADTRKRVKGRFVKAGEAYDYDPLN